MFVGHWLRANPEALINHCVRQNCFFAFEPVAVNYATSPLRYRHRVVLAKQLSDNGMICG